HHGLRRGRLRRLLRLRPPRPASAHPPRRRGSAMIAASFACPVPVSRYDRVVLGHGSGGRLSAELVNRVFLPAFRNDVLAALEDQATLSVAPGRVAMTTDAFVVQPIFFPGGDIG